MDWWVFILIYVIFSAVGGLASKRAKQRASSSRSKPQAPTTAAQNPQGPEDIGAEIRRVMGFEREESTVEVIEEVYEPTVTETSLSGPEPYEREFYEADPSEPSPYRRSVQEPQHGGHLHEDLLVGQESGHHGPGELATRHLERPRTMAASTIGSRRVGTLARQRDRDTTPRARQFSGSAYVDISNIAKALVTMEVLGPPKALRNDEWPML